MHPIRLAIALSLVCVVGLHANEQRVSPISTREMASSRPGLSAVEFSIGSETERLVLIRAIRIDPSFSPNIDDPLPPSLALFDRAQTLIALSDEQQTLDVASLDRVNSLASTLGPADSSLLVTLPPGVYTAQIDIPGGAQIEAYDLTPPETTSVSATVKVETDDSSVPRSAATTIPEPGSATSALAGTAPHSADNNEDFRFSLSELTRVIELYNTMNGSTRTGGYRLEATSEDGFAADPTTPASATVTLARYHSVDTNRDGKISLYELTRVIQLYNFRTGTIRTGDYRVEASSEDGFASGAGNPVVTLIASKSASDESGNNPGELTFTRSGSTSAALAISYAVGGTAINGTDYALLNGALTIPAGAATAKLAVSPNPDLQTEGTATAVLTLAENSGYLVGSKSSATVTNVDSPATLYFAALRPETGASDSTGSGSATIVINAAENLATVNVAYSNLSSDVVSAHLRISPSGDFVANVPRTQNAGTAWRFTPVGIYTSTDLVNALKSGNIFVGIDTSKYPSGELRGAYITGSGSHVFTAPAAPPLVSLVATTAAEAARFLTQATFGPTKSEIDALAGQSIDSWLTAQLALPFSAHRSATVADRSTYGGSPSTTNFNAIYPPNRQVAWFTRALTTPDQLRQRVAFALSQIFVVSDVSLGNDNQTEPLANYYDILGNGAFGNFRTLLENVTLSPMMGIYLSSLRNAKADPVAGTTPDENFAREVMQLFTIGLNQLQPDGTLKLGAEALPIATYNQTTITEMAKVFTGWGYPSANLNAFRSATANYFAPMQLFPSFHDTTAKSIVNAVVLPANLAGTEDLRLTLDALFNHPNTGPFISKQLIQRLITSNPSPAYIYRVAQKFSNNGSGVRGDLTAVVRAIYADYEARSSSVAGNITYGKLKEPLLRLTALLRGFGASASSGRYAGFQVTLNGTPISGSNPPLAAGETPVNNGSSTNISGVQNTLAEAALRSPTVFNFFSPSYVVPGPLAAAGLVAPEFQITDDTTSINVPNFFRGFVFASNTATTVAASATLALNLTYEQTLVPTPIALVDHLNLVLASGRLSTTARDRIVTALGALPAATSTLDRARSAVLLVATSPASAIQK